MIVGEGEERPAIEGMIREKDLGGMVHLVGPKPYQELHSYYGLAEAFIHASTTEQWGLVVNEAMASGLPVLVSNRCGCAADLVKEGVNGFTFDPTDEEQIAGLLGKISRDPEGGRAMGVRSREIIACWSPSRFAQGITAAVRVALAGKKPKRGLMGRSILALMSLR